MKISIIIPTYNEEETISENLEILFRDHKPEEVIVVDGGSEDKTVRLAREFLEVEVIQSEKGRAQQMNAGAKFATGDVLVFLHADTQLPEDGLNYIKEALLAGRTSGRFRMKFDDRRLSLRIFESYTSLPCFSYGDQVFFVRREIFDQLEGYRENVPFEDVDFYRRLSKQTRPVILKPHVITSARRFCKVGSMRQKFINLFLVGLYYAGFNVTPLKAKYYTDVR